VPQFGRRDAHDALIALAVPGAAPADKVACGRRAGETIATKRKKMGGLWSNGRGRFRTQGEYSSAAVRGSKWRTSDRCNSASTSVKQGSVRMRDFVERRTVLVRAGKRYVARRRNT